LTRGDCLIPPRPYSAPEPRQRFNAAPKEGEAYINDQIRADPVRLIDANGDPIGIVPLRVALARAADAGLDLVEIAATAQPPVCKLLNYGKFKYEEQKKKNEARKKQKVIEIKEIKLRPGIDDHDFEVKIKAIRRFIGEGDKVKVTLRFRGRENAHTDLGMKVMERAIIEVQEIAKAEQAPKFEGRQLMMMLTPKA
jgi:translation initiation factor IF-3